MPSKESSTSNNRLDLSNKYIALKSKLATKETTKQVVVAKKSIHSTTRSKSNYVAREPHTIATDLACLQSIPRYIGSSAKGNLPPAHANHRRTPAYCEKVEDYNQLHKKHAACITRLPHTMYYSEDTQPLAVSFRTTVQKTQPHNLINRNEERYDNSINHQEYSAERNMHNSIYSKLYDFDSSVDYDWPRHQPPMGVYNEIKMPRKPKIPFAVLQSDVPKFNLDDAGYSAKTIHHVNHNLQNSRPTFVLSTTNRYGTSATKHIAPEIQSAVYCKQSSKLSSKNEDMPYTKKIEQGMVTANHIECDISSDQYSDSEQLHKIELRAQKSQIRTSRQCNTRQLIASTKYTNRLKNNTHIQLNTLHVDNSPPDMHTPPITSRSSDISFDILSDTNKQKS